MKEYCLIQDPFSNWYCVPISIKIELEKILLSDNLFNYETWDQYLEYKIEIEKLIFYKPKKASL